MLYIYYHHKTRLKAAGTQRLFSIVVFCGEVTVVSLISLLATQFKYIAWIAM